MKRNKPEQKHIYIVHTETVRAIARGLTKITLQEASEKKLVLIGEPFGESLEHCIILGLKYSKDFRKRVKYYTEIDPQRGDYRWQIKQVANTLPHKAFFVNFYGERQ